MKKLLLILPAVLMGFISQSQLLNWSPDFPTDATTGFTITVDATKGNQGLLGYTPTTDVYVHTGVITNLSTSSSDWRYVKFGSTPNLFNTAVAGLQATSAGTNKWQYTLTGDIRSFYGVPAGETILKIAILFRSGNGSKKQANSDGSDMYIPVYQSGQLAVRLTNPLREPRYVPFAEPITKIIGDNVSVSAVASQASDLNLKFNGTSFQTAAGATSVSGTSGNIITSGTQQIIAEATLSGTTVRDTINFFVAPPANQAALPANVKDGINYITSDSVVLVLFAPGKSRVSVIGDFNNWTEQSAYQMNITPDGRRYWLGIGKLTPGQEYGFQYYVNGTLKITDPYCEKILDPNNDPYISSATYPSPTPYPTGKTSGIVGIIKTGTTPYAWTANSYVRPNKKNLVIYELLVRDFVAAQNYQTLTDTLNYLQNLGINAIELMPFNEFEGNNSWGYNPDFFFAVDKAYGTKDKLKQFIDECHKRGIAVIMDAVFNHATGLSPLAQLYWDAANNRPASNNPWLNPTATHPFSVFNDFNHESDSTKYHVSRFIRYWLTEYKIDGFRWDLSKGFTQKVSADVGTWNTYDATRVAIWQRYYDSIQAVSPGAYCILEHLGNDDEEAELARRGMMLWGKMTDQYNQNTMGYSSNIDISRAYWTNRSYWNDGSLNDKPHLVAFAESHDEERTMYKNIAFGNSSGGYNVKDTATALQREEAKAAFLLMVPGPKMIWQFEELGYDKSIFMCENGTIPAPYGTDNCKVNPKPAGWNYFNFSNASARRKLYNVYAALNRLRTQFPGVFNSRTIASGTNFGTLFKTIVLDSSSLKAVVIANFDVVQQTANVTFPSTGTWYSYLTGATLDVSSVTKSITLQPGEYYVYLNRLVSGGVVTATRDIVLGNKDFKLAVYPNPVRQASTVDYELPESGKVFVTITNMTGQVIGTLNKGFQLKGRQYFTLNSSAFGAAGLVSGNYLLQLRVNNKVRIEKISVQR